MTDGGRGAGPGPGTRIESGLVPEARRLHRESFVFDGHNDLALRILDGEDPSERTEGGHLDLPRMREGGLDGGIFAVWVPPGSEDPLGRVLEGVEELHRFLSDTPGIRPVLRTSDLEAARAGGEVAAVVGVEGGYGVRSPDDVTRLHAAGVRCLTLTWSSPTAWADAAGAPPRHGGLTRTGRAVVRRLEELGVLVDVSHASDEAARQVLEVAEAPVVASHSGFRAVARHPRNLPDALLEALAATGGVVGVNFFPAYLDEGYGRRFEDLRDRSGRALFTPDGRRALEEAAENLPPVGLDRVAAHVRHGVEVAGEAHVGLGSDFDGVPVLPEGMEDVRDLPRVTAALVREGLSPGTIRGVLGDNFLRVLREVLS